MDMAEHYGGWSQAHTDFRKGCFQKKGANRWEDAVRDTGKLGWVRSRGVIMGGPGWAVAHLFSIQAHPNRGKASQSTGWDSRLQLGVQLCPSPASLM